MPIAFVLVAMVTLFSGWYEHNVLATGKERQLRMEAKAVASNIINYRQQIQEYAQYLDAGGNASNWALFIGYSGDASGFIQQAKAAGRIPATMSWFPGPMAGVTGYIQNGVLTVSYVQPSAAYASQAGVQTELLNYSNGSYTVGRAF